MSKQGGIKDIAAGRSDVYRLAPDLIHVKEGWNTRDANDPSNAEHVEFLATSIAEIGGCIPLKHVDNLAGESRLPVNATRDRLTANVIACGNFDGRSICHDRGLGADLRRSHGSGESLHRSVFPRSISNCVRGILYLRCPFPSSHQPIDDNVGHLPAERDSELDVAGPLRNKPGVTSELASRLCSAERSGGVFSDQATSKQMSAVVEDAAAPTSPVPLATEASLPNPEASAPPPATGGGGGMSFPGLARQVTFDATALDHWISDAELDQLTELRKDNVIEIFWGMFGTFAGSLVPALERFSKVSNPESPIDKIDLLVLTICSVSLLLTVIMGVFWYQRSKSATTSETRKRKSRT